jgi:hypothetical protein
LRSSVLKVFFVVVFGFFPSRHLVICRKENQQDTLFLVVLQFELRVFYFLGRQSTTWDTTPALKHTVFWFLFFSNTKVWTQALHLELLYQPFFCCDGFFQDRACQDWLGTGISWSPPPEDYRIIGVSHRCPADTVFHSCLFAIVCIGALLRPIY